PPGDVDRRGVNEIAEAFGMQSISVDIEPKLTAEEIKVIGDFAYLVGISLATISPKDGGQTNKVKLRIVWLLRKEAGIWKIAREIWNSKPL
ncbi:MAG: YybH family protein, partial [Hassallia sp.]